VIKEVESKHEAIPQIANVAKWKIEKFSFGLDDPESIEELEK